MKKILYFFMGLTLCAVPKYAVASDVQPKVVIVVNGDTIKSGTPTIIKDGDHCKAFLADAEGNDVMSLGDNCYSTEWIIGYLNHDGSGESYPDRSDLTNVQGQCVSVEFDVTPETLKRINYGGKTPYVDAEGERYNRFNVSCNVTYFQENHLPEWASFYSRFYKSDAEVYFHVLPMKPELLSAKLIGTTMNYLIDEDGTRWDYECYVCATEANIPPHAKHSYTYFYDGRVYEDFLFNDAYDTWTQVRDTFLVDIHERLTPQLWLRAYNEYGGVDYGPVDVKVETSVDHVAQDCDVRVEELDGGIRVSSDKPLPLVEAFSADGVLLCQERAERQVVFRIPKGINFIKIKTSDNKLLTKKIIIK